MMMYVTPLSPKKSLTGKTVVSNSNYLKVLLFEEFVSGAHRGIKAEFSSDKLQGK